MKIYDVDFKNKKLNFSFDHGTDEREILAQQICEAFRTSLPKIKKLSSNDPEFVDYCLKALAGIVSRLRDSI